MPRCAVVNCHCGYDGFPTPGRWFKVPKSQARRDQWEFRMNRKDFKITEHTQICSIHFKEDDYIPECENKDSSGRKRKKRHLKSSAVPSLHMGNCKCPIHHKSEKSTQNTGKSLSEALFFASTNPQYDDRLFIELQVQYIKLPSSNLGRTCCVQKLFLKF